MRKGSAVILLLMLLPQWTAANEFIQGTAPIKSLDVLEVGPEGILFIGDSQSAAVFAIDLKDTTPNPSTEALQVQNIDEKIAATLGTTAKDIRIRDLAVNTISQNAYLSVTRGQGNEAVQVLLRVDPAGALEVVALENVLYAVKDIANPVGQDAKDRRGRSLRRNAITDLAYAHGELYIAGLSNEEFSSTLRVVSFPFDAEETASSLEIYHAAHQKYETHSPIRTLMAYELDQVPHVLAAYTCTPLVTIPIEQVQDGVHLKGKTVGELGSGNRPLDMIAYKNQGKEFILLANSNRALMKIDPDHIVDQKEGLTEPVDERFGTAGVHFITTNQVGVQQLDDLNAGHVLVVQRMGDGALNLRALRKNRL